MELFDITPKAMGSPCNDSMTSQGGDSFRKLSGADRIAVDKLHPLPISHRHAYGKASGLPKRATPFPPAAAR
jgi:hypothetical protein